MKNFTKKSLCLVVTLMFMLVPSVSFAVAKVIIPGDVNANGYCNVEDVTVLIDHLLTANTDSWFDDVNGDGSVNIADVTCLVDGLLGSGVPQSTTYQGPAVPQNAEVIDVNGVPLVMIPVEAGSFQYYDLTIHMSGFSIAQTEVTKELWNAVMGEVYVNLGSAYDISPLQPIENITWLQCQQFIAKLNQITGREFKLPTWCQWTFAAIGGNQSHYYLYSGSDNVNEVAWNMNNRPSSLVDPNVMYTNPYTMPVGLLLPNELGLYDMSGNVEEWVADRFPAFSHMGNELYDPVTEQIPGLTNERAYRGGSAIAGAFNLLHPGSVHQDPESVQMPCRGFRIIL